MTVRTSVLWKINIHMAKKWPEKVIQRSFIKEHSFANRLYVSSFFLKRGQIKYFSLIFSIFDIIWPQCPRTDLNIRNLPRPKTTTAWKLIPHRSKISKNWNPPHWVPLHRFFKNWFLLMQKQLYSITFKLILLSRKVPNV